jgi:tetratricopeptide (TPR) repeat protein
MSDLTRTIQETLEKQLSKSGAELIDLIPIPPQGDRMVRLRTLEEALSEFDQLGDDAVSYLIQLKPLRSPRQAPPDFAAFPEVTPSELEAPSQSRKAAHENIYLTTGKLNIPFLLRNADLLLTSGDWTLAKNIFKTILASGEHAAAALCGYGRCLQAEGKLEEARAKFDESIAYQASLECYRLLGSLLIQMGKEGLAGEAFERAVSMKDLSPATRFELCKAAGNCYTRAGQTSLAERMYHRALEIDPSADGIRANLGALYLGLGKNAEAARHFQDSLASNPRNAKALSGLGSIMVAEGNRKAAHDHFARSLDLELANPTAIFHLVKIAYELKSYATAARILGEYVQIAPVNASLLYSLAGLQFHLGRLSDASTTITKILELAPDHSGATELRAIIARYSPRQ